MNYVIRFNAKEGTGIPGYSYCSSASEQCRPFQIHCAEAIVIKQKYTQRTKPGMPGTQGQKSSSRNKSHRAL